jgi:hypothetical protein
MEWAGMPVNVPAQKPPDPIAGNLLILRDRNSRIQDRPKSDTYDFGQASNGSLCRTFSDTQLPSAISRQECPEARKLAIIAASTTNSDRLALSEGSPMTTRALGFRDDTGSVHARDSGLAKAGGRACGGGFGPSWTQLPSGRNSGETDKLMSVNVVSGKSGEPGRTRTSNPLFGLRNAKYSMFQAVSSFRAWQEWAVLGVVVISVVTKCAEGGMSSPTDPLDLVRPRSPCGHKQMCPQTILVRLLTARTEGQNRTRTDVLPMSRRTTINHSGTLDLSTTWLSRKGFPSE